MSITDYSFLGGNESAERKVLILGESYDNGFGIISLQNIDTSISHRDILGTLISLGIDREKIGDIVYNNEIVEFTLLDEAIDIVLYSLDRIKNTPVKAKLKDSYELQESSIVDKNYKGTVASMRLDCIIAELMKTARTKAQVLIKQGKVKVNHVEERKINVLVDEDDVISVSGTGRFVIKSKGNLTKKNRTIIEYIKKG